MIQIKPTPFFLTSTILFVYGLYALLFFDPGEEGWGTLAAIIFCVVGVINFILYAILRVIFKARIWFQVGIEVIVIIGLLYFGYKESGVIEFQLPHKFRGNIVIVYGVDNAPKLNKPFYSNKIKLNVPPSGIILTSSAPDNSYSRPANFLDSTLGEIEKLPIQLRRYGLPHSSDTLICNYGKYFTEIWTINIEPAWSIRDDSVNKLDLKLQEACWLIQSQKIPTGANVP